MDSRLLSVSKFHLIQGGASDFSGNAEMDGRHLRLDELDDAHAEQAQGFGYIHFCHEWIAMKQHSSRERMQYISYLNFRTARAEVIPLRRPCFLS